MHAIAYLTQRAQAHFAISLKYCSILSTVFLNQLYFLQKSPAKSFDNFYKVSEYFVYDIHMPLPRFALITSAKLAREMGVVSGSINVYKKVSKRIAIIAPQVLTTSPPQV